MLQISSKHGICKNISETKGEISDLAHDAKEDLSFSFISFYFSTK